MIGFIYLWINNINGKKYVGLHKGLSDDGYIGSGVAFKKAIEKYGIENFERKILHEEYSSEESLYQKEFDIINNLNAVFSTEYYNMTNYDPKCVKFINGEKCRVMSDETKKKMSDVAKMRIVSDETKRKMSESRIGKKFKKKNGIIQSGKNNPQYGKKWYNDSISDGIFIPGSEPEFWKLGRLRGIHYGNKNGFYGKTHSPESKQKIRDTIANRKGCTHEVDKKN